MNNTISSRTIGIISDTHGIVSAKALLALEGVDQIWHAGDIGSMEVITELSIIAPVIGVSGNTDNFPVISKFPMNQVIEVFDLRILLTHVHLNNNFVRLINSSWESDKNFDVIIFGHTHRPLIRKHQSVLYFNPGSARQPRGNKIPTIGRLTIYSDNSVDSQIINL